MPAHALWEFSDVDGSAHQASIEGLHAQGLFDGTECGDGLFCPGDPLPRWVMAVWLVRALDGGDPAAGGGSRFGDVETDAWWAGHAERLAELEVTVGCKADPVLYCPHRPVTRAQMAVFLGRAFDLDPAAGTGFVDTAGNFASAHIDALYAAGITMGCSTAPLRYCPDESVTRGAMATFLNRALELGAGRSSTPVEATISSSPAAAGDGFEVVIAFSEAVNGFEIDDIDVVNGRVVSLTGSGASYRAAVSPATGGAVVIRVRRSPSGAGDEATSLRSEPYAWLPPSGSHADRPGIDTWDRAAVERSARSELHRDPPEAGFTGSVDGCVAGTTSQSYRDSVIQRVNWYRAMAGLPPVTENASYSASAQQAALMMVAEGDLSHDPGPGWACYTPLGDAAAGQSNLALGNIGTDAIDAYMEDGGSNNKAVGHRRWITSRFLKQIGTGDFDFEGGRSWLASAGPSGPANALYVIGEDMWSEWTDTREDRYFVAWPASGYVPRTVVFPRWSFMVAQADFSTADITMSNDAGPVPTTVIYRSRGSSLPEQTIVWEIDDQTVSEASNSLDELDRCYEIVVTGVRHNGDLQTPYEYMTCSFSLSEDGG